MSVWRILNTPIQFGAKKMSQPSHPDPLLVADKSQNRAGSFFQALPRLQLVPFNKIRSKGNNHVSHKLNKRRYDGALINRLTADWVTSSTSADSELLSSLRNLRNRSRDLVRNNDYARGAIRTIVNNVVGKGISLQSQVKKRRNGLIDETTNANIESLWTTWNNQKYCHTGGKLCFADIERLILRSIVESGEVLIRFVTKAFDGSPVPLALEIIEADQLADDYSNSCIQAGHEIRMGIELDEWKRPVAYWLHRHHPGDYQFSSRSSDDRLIRVPAEEILHLYVCDRPGQTRGIPWLHSAISRLRHVGGYEEAELVAARAQAAVMGFIESPEPASTFSDEPYNSSIKSLEPGGIETLAPGEKFVGFAPTRPGSGFDPFIKLMLRGVSTGLGLSYEALSRDLSQVNYSSARIGMLEDRDYWRILQGWLIRNFHQPLFERWLDLAVLSGALNLPSYELSPKMYTSPRWIARGWTWVDPAREIDASVNAIRCGLSTLTSELGEAGLDIEDVLAERRRELDYAASLNLVLDTDPLRKA